MNNKFSLKSTCRRQYVEIGLYVDVDVDVDVEDLRAQANASMPALYVPETDYSKLCCRVVD